MLVVQSKSKDTPYTHDIKLITECISKLYAYQLMLNKAKRKPSKISILEEIVVNSTTLTSVGTWTLSNLTFGKGK
jgi:hypothetical protein